MAFIQKSLIILCLLLNGMIVANQPQLDKFRSVITTEFKGYNISDTESIQLYGAKHRKFINDNLYWGEAGYGALFGERSGYLEGGVFIGRFFNAPNDLLIDIRFFTGAGGGGSAPQGGGFIIHPTIGIGKPLSRSIFFMVELGYMLFVNGDIESVSLGASLNLNSWKLKQRRP